ncbi:MAG TPA: cohesin domain-containing protein [bacterium]|nr:cohesin domain-containing protein [bacterium]
MNKRLLYILTLIVAVGFALALGGCNKSDDDDDNDNNGDDDNDDFTATSISFTPAGEAQAGDIWLELAESAPAKNTFTLNVRGNAIAETYGVAGRLLFDRELTSLDSAEPGDALAGNDAQIKALGGSNDQGGVFGISRSGDYTHSVTLDAAKIIGTLQFTVSAAGTTDITFNEERSTILNHDFELAEVSNWLGGTLVVE